MLQHKRRTLSALQPIYYYSTCWWEILTQGPHPNHTASSARKYQLLPAAFWSSSFFVCQICISQLYKKTLLLGSWNTPALVVFSPCSFQACHSYAGCKLPVLHTEMHSSGSTSQTAPALGWWNTHTCAGACLGGWGAKHCTFTPRHHPSSWLPQGKGKQKVGNAFFACTSCLLSPPGWGSLESVGMITGTRKLNAFCCFDHIRMVSHAIHFARVRDSRVGFTSSNLR